MRIFQKDELLFDPKEPAAAPAAEQTTTETQPTAATSTESSATTTEPSVESTPTAPVSAPSWTEGFRDEGISFSDENQARQQLTQAYRDAERLRPLAPVLSTYQSHAKEFNEWLSEKQRQQAAPASQEDWTKKLGWNHPEWNPAWQNQIIKDDKGNFIPAPGAPADVVLKYQNALQFRQDFVDKFLTNPAKTLEPYIRHVAQEIAQQHAQQGVGQYREQQEAQQFIDKHSSWLFDKAQDGSPKVNAVLNPQTGQYDSQKVLSKYGQMFVQNLQTAAQRGLPADLQQEYALQAVQTAYMATPEYIQWAHAQLNPAAPAATAPSGTAREQANKAAIDKLNPAAPPTRTQAGNSKPAPVEVNRNNLEQVMLARFREAGVTV